MKTSFKSTVKARSSVSSGRELPTCHCRQEGGENDGAGKQGLTCSVRPTSTHLKSLPSKLTMQMGSDLDKVSLFWRPLQQRECQGCDETLAGVVDLASSFTIWIHQPANHADYSDHAIQNPPQHSITSLPDMTASHTLARPEGRWGYGALPAFDCQPYP